jgi:hypothetical protein
MQWLEVQQLFFTHGLKALATDGSPGSESEFSLTSPAAAGPCTAQFPCWLKLLYSGFCSVQLDTIPKDVPP